MEFKAILSRTKFEQTFIKYVTENTRYFMTITNEIRALYKVENFKEKQALFIADIIQSYGFLTDLSRYKIACLILSECLEWYAE